MKSEIVAKQIQSLRKSKGITQNELGERLHVSYQAVSKWERGEALPDITILPDLANVLETTIDNILLGGERVLKFHRKTTVEDIKNGIECLVRLGELLGKESTFYCGAIEGISSKMNMDLQAALDDPYQKEALIAEATIQSIISGVYVDITDIKKSFAYPHWVTVVTGFAEKYGIL